MKRILGGVGGLVALLVAVVVARTLMFVPVRNGTVPLVAVEVDEARITRHMSEAIRFKTISPAVGQTPDYAPFVAFVAWVQEAWPEVQEELELEMIADHTMLYRWQGQNDALRPVLLTAHYDVVPVAPGSEGDWSHPPFSGLVADGYVWGRGGIDDKSGVIVMLEAIKLLLDESHVPERTIYFSFSHDEERGGVLGASSVTEHLKANGVQLAWTIDEGGFVVSGMLPGSDAQVAMINVAEKGSVTLDLIARSAGGHSSMPPPEVSIDILAKALVNLRQHPVPGGLDGMGGEMLDSIARNGPFMYRMLFANRWLFGGLIEARMARSGGMNAMLRTTTAPTILRAGIKTNVIPTTATASVNFRIHPRDTVESVIEHVRGAIADDRVEIKAQGAHRRSPSRVSSAESDGFRAIVKATRQIYGDVLIVPGITIGGTDTKHYGKVAENSYRFHPMVVGPEDIARVHGTDERISIENLVKGTGAYYLLLKEAAGG